MGWGGVSIVAAATIMHADTSRLQKCFKVIRCCQWHARAAKLSGLAGGWRAMWPEGRPTLAHAWGGRVAPPLNPPFPWAALLFSNVLHSCKQAQVWDLAPSFLPPATQQPCRPAPDTHSRCWHQGTARRHCWPGRPPAQAHPASWCALQQMVAAVADAAPAAVASWADAPSQRCCLCCHLGCRRPRWPRSQQPGCRPPHQSGPAQTYLGQLETRAPWPSRSAAQRGRAAGRVRPRGRRQ